MNDKLAIWKPWTASSEAASTNAKKDAIANPAWLLVLICDIAERMASHFT